MDTPNHHEVPVNERFTLIFKEYNVSMYEIAKELGVDSSKFSKITKGVAKPGYETIQGFLHLFPDLSLDFIMKGVGPIRKGRANADMVASGWVEVPFVPVRAYASFSKNYSDGVKMEDLEKVRVLSSVLDSAQSKLVVVLEIDGNSMSPQLPDGSRVLASYVSPSDWVYASSGVFAILYRDFFVVKRIRQNDLIEKGFLNLYSDNEKHGSMTVQRSDIRGIWKVLRIVDSRVE